MKPASIIPRYLLLIGQNETGNFAARKFLIGRTETGCQFQPVKTCVFSRRNLLSTSCWRFFLSVNNKSLTIPDAENFPHNREEIFFQNSLKKKYFKALKRPFIRLLSGFFKAIKRHSVLFCSQKTEMFLH